MKKTISIILLISVLLACASMVFAVSVTDFTDVKQDDWFYDSVKFVTDKDMFKGTTLSTFSPLDPMTRGMFVTVIGRYSNAPNIPPSENGAVVTASDVNMRAEPTTNSRIVAHPPKNTQVEVLDTVVGTTDSSYEWHKLVFNGVTGYIREDLLTLNKTAFNFSDVPSDAYYAGYVHWAYTNGIADKTGETTFSPNQNITREEICDMLFNLMEYKNLSPEDTIPAQTFNDSASINTAYANAVSKMQRLGVIKGFPDGGFRPNDKADRAEVSTMLTRYIYSVGYHPSTGPSVDEFGNYIWGADMPESASVNTAHFDNTAFIGHSIVVGMEIYFNLPNADFYATNGAHSNPNYAGSILTHTGFPLPTTHTDDAGNVTQNTGTLEDCLSATQYDEVYIMLGANEINVGEYHEKQFYKNMSSLIDMVRETQPNAKIYLYSFTPVSQELSEEREDLSRDNIIAFNDVLRQLSKDKFCYYLNVFDLLVNADGFLPDDASMDGLHINLSEYAKIKTYIFTHTA